MQAGKSSIQFEHPPIITSAASIVGQTEGEGPLASFFDRVEPDPTFGKKSWEEAESELQRQTVQKCLDKAGRQAARAAVDVDAVARLAQLSVPAEGRAEMVWCGVV